MITRDKALVCHAEGRRGNPKVVPTGPFDPRILTGVVPAAGSGAARSKIEIAERSDEIGEASAIPANT